MPATNSLLRTYQITPMKNRIKISIRLVSDSVLGNRHAVGVLSQEESIAFPFEFMEELWRGWDGVADVSASP